MRRRDFAGPQDLLAMQRAVQRTWTPESRCDIGDLAWGRNAVPGQQPDWRTALWEDDEGAVVAWGWAELQSHLDLYVDPAHAELASDVLVWFEELATSSDISVTVLDAEAHLVAALERAAYRPIPQVPFFQHCLRDLRDPPVAPRLPAGYRVRAVREDEAERRAAAHRAAWRPARIGELLVPPVDLGTTESRVTATSYQAVMNAWPYRHDLDQVVEAPDGTLVAFALGWLDEVNRVGELEPVGTDPLHARRGLGSAVSLACLHAMRDAGATRAVVYPRGDSAYPVARQLSRSRLSSGRADRHLRSMSRRPRPLDAATGSRAGRYDKHVVNHRGAVVLAAILTLRPGRSHVLDVRGVAVPRVPVR